MKAFFKNRSKKKIRYYFKVRSSRSQSWFALDLKRLKTNFKTRKPEFYKCIFQLNIEGHVDSEAFKFSVTIGDKKS